MVILISIKRLNFNPNFNVKIEFLIHKLTVLNRLSIVNTFHLADISWPNFIEIFFSNTSFTINFNLPTSTSFSDILISAIPPSLFLFLVLPTSIKSSSTSNSIRLMDENIDRKRLMFLFTLLLLQLCCLIFVAIDSYLVYCSIVFNPKNPSSSYSTSSFSSMLFHTHTFSSSLPAHVFDLFSLSHTLRVYLVPCVFLLPYNTWRWNINGNKLLWGEKLMFIKIERDPGYFFPSLCCIYDEKESLKL